MNRRQTVTTPEGREMILLPGCAYQRYLAPLDYAPSRDYQARWGGTRPPHAGLLSLCQASETTSCHVIQEMNALHDYFLRIPLELTQTSIGWKGGAMNALDLGILYTMIARTRPRRYIEIGCGQSTFFVRQAIRDHFLQTHLITIDPEPRANIRELADQNIPYGMETLQDLSIFSELEPNDILFIDGSHRSFTNSDVTVLLLDVIPYLKPGVLVHFHDIFIPRDYSGMFLDWYWNEQYILSAFLLGAAARAEVLMPCYYVSTVPRLIDLVRAPAIPGLDDGYWRSGGSFWFTLR